jgi:hypothetical protein
MATQGGSGTLQPPGDDNVAPVIPLRQRHSEPSEPSTPRKPLPRERAAFDPELEPGDIALPRRRPRPAALSRVRQATARLHLQPHLTVTTGALAVIAMAGVATAAMLGSPFTTPGARHPPAATRRATPPIVQTQLTEANAEKTRYALTRRATGAHRARLKHDRTRTRKAARPAASTARHRTPPKGASTRSTTTAHSSEVVTNRAAAVSGTQASPASSSHSWTGSASSATGATSPNGGSTPDQSPKLPPGPTGVGSAGGCNPKCS